MSSDTDDTSTMVSPQPSRRSYRHIEYRAEAITFSRDFHKLTMVLNELGEEGWEVLEFQFQNGNDGALVLLQREVFH